MAMVYREGGGEFRSGHLIAFRCSVILFLLQKEEKLEKLASVDVQVSASTKQTYA